MAVEAEPVHGAAGAEGQRVARLVDNAGKRVGAGDSGQAVLGTVAPVDQVGQVALGDNIRNIYQTIFFFLERQPNKRGFVKNSMNAGNRSSSRICIEVHHKMAV